jgi:NADH pyrophosphatase NudC (nudix superfamily)
MTREEAIKSVKETTIKLVKEVAGMSLDWDDAHYDALQMAIKALEQEPKTGHWKYGYAFADGNYCKCSECKEIIKCTYPMHYCPNCGAKMVDSQESEDKE